MKPELKIVASNDLPEPAPAEAAPEQVEMPFAVVNGEPITQLPRDLYIPPQALEVFLEAFEGPLDLLLYLIRRQNLDVLDIPIAEITRQYMQYIEVMQDLQLELAGEYLVMAATLAEIKSRMLLPRAHVEGQTGEEDPRAELVRRLQEYERFKQAAENIDGLPRLERDVWSASAELKDRKVVRALPQVTLQEMLVAFKEVVVRSEMFAHHHIERERLSVRARMTDILSSLERASFVDFVRLFRPEEGRMGITVTFVAILELVREGLIEIVQAEPFAPLHVRAAGPNRGLRLVADNDTVAEPVAPEEIAALAEIGVEEAFEAFEDEDTSIEEDDFLASLDAPQEVASSADEPAEVNETTGMDPADAVERAVDVENHEAVAAEEVTAEAMADDSSANEVDAANEVSVEQSTSADAELEPRDSPDESGNSKNADEVSS